jgi:methionine aminotransferase
MTAPLIASKLPAVGTTIFTVMSRLAEAHGAINLGQGFPDYPMDAQLMELVNEAMHNHHNQYAPMPGYGPLLEAIAAKVYRCYSTQLDPTAQITITPGGTYAIYCAITTTIKPGDEVIVFEPAYDSYIPNIVVNGGVPVRIPLRHPQYSIPWDAVKQAIGPRTRMIIINSPHNPTGSVLDAADMQQLQQLTEGSPIVIVSDEVYEHLIFGGKTHCSILQYPDLLARSFVSFSFGKVYNCTGWKLGYSISSPALTAEFRKVHQFNCFSCFMPAQVAIATYLQHDAAYLTLGEQLYQKQQLFQRLMAHTPLKPLPTYGSYFQLYSYEGLSQMPEAELAIELTRKAGVAAIPVSAFYTEGTHNHVLRFCFAKKESTLRAAAARLVKYFGEYPQKPGQIATALAAE